jgi:hypothetical protein
MLKFAFIAAGLVLAPAPAFAQIVFDDTPAAVAAPAKSDKSDLDKIVCRMQDTIGSRVQAKKVCLSKQQWWQLEQENKRKVQEIQDRTPAPSSG